MLRSGTFPLLLLCALVGHTGTAHPQSNTLAPINPVAGAETWEWSGGGVSVRLTQILPDQVRGFYQARGFSAADAELLAQQGCLFQTVIRNQSTAEPVELDLGEWRVATSQGLKPIRLERDWQHEWDARGVSGHAKLAFRWALFPTVQVFSPGDWNMGMTTYGLPQGARFDLTMKWRVADGRAEGTIRDLRCANEGSR